MIKHVQQAVLFTSCQSKYFQVTNDRRKFNMKCCSSYCEWTVNKLWEAKRKRHAYKNKKTSPLHTLDQKKRTLCLIWMSCEIISSWCPFFYLSCLEPSHLSTYIAAWKPCVHLWSSLFPVFAFQSLQILAPLTRWLWLACQTMAAKRISTILSILHCALPAGCVWKVAGPGRPGVWLRPHSHSARWAGHNEHLCQQPPRAERRRKRGAADRGGLACQKQSCSQGHCSSEELSAAHRKSKNHEC